MPQTGTNKTKTHMPAPAKKTVPSAAKSTNVKTHRKGDTSQTDKTLELIEEQLKMKGSGAPVPRQTDHKDTVDRVISPKKAVRLAKSLESEGLSLDNVPPNVVLVPWAKEDLKDVAWLTIAHYCQLYPGLFVSSALTDPGILCPSEMMMYLLWASLSHLKKNGKLSGSKLGLLPDFPESYYLPKAMLVALQHNSPYHENAVTYVSHYPSYDTEIYFDNQCITPSGSTWVHCSEAFWPVALGVAYYTSTGASTGQVNEYALLTTAAVTSVSLSAWSRGSVYSDFFRSYAKGWQYSTLGPSAPDGSAYGCPAGNASSRGGDARMFYPCCDRNKELGWVLSAQRASWCMPFSMEILDPPQFPIGYDIGGGIYNYVSYPDQEYKCGFVFICEQLDSLDLTRPFKKYCSYGGFRLKTMKPCPLMIDTRMWQQLVYLSAHYIARTQERSVANCAAFVLRYATLAHTCFLSRMNKFLHIPLVQDQFSNYLYTQTFATDPTVDGAMLHTLVSQYLSDLGPIVYCGELFIPRLLNYNSNPWSWIGQVITTPAILTMTTPLFSLEGGTQAFDACVFNMNRGSTLVSGGVGAGTFYSNFISNPKYWQVPWAYLQEFLDPVNDWAVTASQGKRSNYVRPVSAELVGGYEMLSIVDFVVDSNTDVMVYTLNSNFDTTNWFGLTNRITARQMSSFAPVPGYYGVYALSFCHIKAGDPQQVATSPYSLRLGGSNIGPTVTNHMFQNISVPDGIYDKMVDEAVNTRHVKDQKRLDHKAPGGLEVSSPPLDDVCFKEALKSIARSALPLLKPLAQSGARALCDSFAPGSGTSCSMLAGTVYDASVKLAKAGVNNKK